MREWSVDHNQRDLAHLRRDLALEHLHLVLQAQPQLLRSQPGGEMNLVGRMTGGDRLSTGGGCEKTPSDLLGNHPGSMVAKDRSGGVGSRQTQGGYAVSSFNPQVGIDPPDPIDEHHLWGRLDRNQKGSPLRLGNLDIEPNVRLLADLNAASPILWSPGLNSEPHRLVNFILGECIGRA